MEQELSCRHRPVVGLWAGSLPAPGLASASPAGQWTHVQRLGQLVSPRLIRESRLRTNVFSHWFGCVPVRGIQSQPPELFGPVDGVCGVCDLSFARPNRPATAATFAHERKP